IQEIARERDIAPVEDRKFDRYIDLQSVHDDYVRDWESGEEGALKEDKAACEFILEHSGETNPSGSNQKIEFDDIVEQPRRFLANGGHWTSPVEEEEAY
ncbi:MAG: nitrate reductase, partial [Halobacteria archaeon]|nr:nitrate reductase [Halobacteria archaeon]